MKKKINRRDAIMGAATAGLTASLIGNNSMASTDDTLTKKPVAILKTDLELYGPCNGFVDLISAVPSEKPFQNLLIVGRDLPGSNIYRADYGGHYHIDSEIIYITRGSVEVTIRENTGKHNNGPSNEIEELPPVGTSRSFKYKRNPTEKEQVIKVSNDEVSFVIERGGFIEIPGFAFHNVKVLEEADMVAQLPDARRLAQFMPTQPPTCIK